MFTWKAPLVALAAVGLGAGIWYLRAPVPELPSPAIPVGSRLESKAPFGLPPVPVPSDNPPTAETIALGRRLYYDPALSVDNTVACASCHSPELGFSDGKQFSEGVRGQMGGRNAPTVINAAYYRLQFWDGRAPSLESQAEGPVQNPIEMGHTLQGVEKKLMADRSYVAGFEQAFGPGRITYERVGKAIAAFERTVISGNSPFDHHIYGGDKKALSAAARRGLEIFRDPQRGRCAGCHTIGESDALFTDNNFHNLGVGAEGETLNDLGRYTVTKNETDRGRFKTPSLRNIALTAPYMHDGSLKTLKDVIDFYVGGGNSNPNLDPDIKPLVLTRRDRDDLVAFLESLNGERPLNVGRPESSRATVAR